MSAHTPLAVFLQISNSTPLGLYLCMHLLLAVKNAECMIADPYLSTESRYQFKYLRQMELREYRII